MTSIETRRFDSPDETRTPPKTKVDVVRLGGAEVGRFSFEPGWKWSECVGPVVGTDSCQSDHVGYLSSGRLHVVHGDGSSAEISAGDVFRISPGHDAWVIGDDTVVTFEFKGAAEYAKG